MSSGTAIHSALVIVLCFLRGAPAQAAATFTPLGDLPGSFFASRATGVSADASVVVGQSFSINGPVAFRWTSEAGMVALPDLLGGALAGNALDVSHDGSVAVGQGSSANGPEAFRWTSQGGIFGLGDLPGDVFQSIANSVSADGLVIVGAAMSGSGTEGFRWTDGGGMTGLGDLPGGNFRSVANSISADGSVVVGQGRSTIGDEAFRWTSEGGMVAIPDLLGGAVAGNALDVSHDGSVVVGQGSSANGPEAFRWTSQSGIVGLGDLPGGDFASGAFGVSANGSVIVGAGESANGIEAFYWRDDLGIVNLRTLLLAQGAEGLGGWTLIEARGVSADGRTVIGWGKNATGNQEAWMAKIVSQNDIIVPPNMTQIFQNIRADSLTLVGGNSIAIVTANGGDFGTSVVDSLNIGTASKLDLNNNDLIIRSTAAEKDSEYAAIQLHIVSSQNGLDANLVTKWDGPGITSSIARAANVAQGFDLTGLGVIRNSDLDITTGIPGSSYTTFSGQAVTPDDVLVKYTYVGDANLSGAVSFDDYVGMDNAFFGLIPNLGWATGDINFDGVINFDDYSKVDQAFFFQGASLSRAIVPAIPEPMSHMLTVAAGLCAIGLGAARMWRESTLAHAR